MREIITREEREKKDKRKGTIISLILAGLMIFSVAGYAFYDTGREKIDEKKYKELDFILKEDGLWHTEIQGYDFSTIYSPEDTENISGLLTSNIQSYMGKPLFFSYGSETEGIDEITRNINRFVSRVQYVCLDENECEGDWAVKNCTEDNIIIINEDNETLIKQEGNCVYILARERDITRGSDAFVFKILKII